MNCRNCGKEIANNVKFCPECGEKALYEIEVIEVDDNSIVSIKNDVNKDQNKKFLAVQDGFFAKLKIKYENLNIAIKFIIWIILIISCLCIYTDYNQRQEKKEQEKLQVEMDVKYSDGMENLSKGDFINAEKQFSVFSGNFRINTDATDYVIGDKHYKDANILRLYAIAGKEFEKGADPTDTLDKIPNNYSGLFSQEIIALKKSVREMKEKIAAEKEAAEKEKKRKAEEERQRIVQEEKQKKLKKYIMELQKYMGFQVSDVRFIERTNPLSLIIEVDCLLTNTTQQQKMLISKEFVLKKEGYNTVEASMEYGGFYLPGLGRSPETFIKLYPGDSIPAKFYFDTGDRQMNMKGWVLYYVETGKEMVPLGVSQ